MFPYQYTEFEPFAANIYEMEDHYLIIAELPGVLKDDIEITVQSGKITITAKRRKLCEVEKDILCRSFGFDDIDEDNIKANLEAGILSIKIAKKEVKENKTSKIINIE
jgi:HSP20 family protein